MNTLFLGVGGEGEGGEGGGGGEGHITLGLVHHFKQQVHTVLVAMVTLRKAGNPAP